MSAFDIVVIVVISVAVVAVIGTAIYKKVKGKGGGCDGCGGNCMGCSCNCQHSAAPQDKPEDK